MAHYPPPHKPECQWSAFVPGSRCTCLEFDDRPDDPPSPVKVWHDDKWTMILVNDGVSQATVSLTREQAEEVRELLATPETERSELELKTMECASWLKRAMHYRAELERIVEHADGDLAKVIARNALS